MYRRILVPTDGTELCSLALDTALELARIGGGAIVGLHACPLDDPATPPAGTVDPALAAWCHEREQQARDALAYVRRRADDAGVPCETVLAAEAAPFEAIERIAREHGCDLVVMAAHARRGLRARLLGGETEKLLAHGTVPLLIVR
ncbi:universal stress protein [Massilia sp. 9096]|uniref:universal stress protein n=1 Tax=Massilia sp. 9096 TaxID=1500894 RepID=UPI000568DEFD|nr:universal stress protein [Massilia sp. 9096]